MLQLDFGPEGWSKGADIQSAAEKIAQADEVRGSDVRVAFYPSQSFIESNNDPFAALDLQGAIRQELEELPTARDVTKQSNLDQLNVDQPSRATIDPSAVAVAAELDNQFSELDGYVQREGTNIDLVQTTQGGGGSGGEDSGGGKPGGEQPPSGQPTTSPVGPLPNPVPVGPGDVPEDDRIGVPDFPTLPAPGEPIPGPIGGTMPGPFVPPEERPPNERPPDFIPMPGRPPPRVDPNPTNPSPGNEATQAGLGAGRIVFFGGVTAMLLYLVNQ